jgi:hypothetical protein
MPRPAVTPQPSVTERLDWAETLARAGRYAEAQAGYAAVLAPPTAPIGAERALLGLARLALIPENPRRDEREAAGYLDRLLREYPTSAWAPEARTWQDLLTSVGQHRGQVERLRQDVRRHQQEMERLRRDLLREQQDALGLRQTLDRLRQIDIELERAVVTHSNSVAPLAPRQ